MCRKNFTFEKITHLSFDNTIKTVTYSLFKNGFGVVELIDIANTLNNIGISVGPYRIFNICNHTHTVTSNNSDTPTDILLPCNIVIRESSQDNIYVGIFSPNSVLALVNDASIFEMIERIKLILEKEFNQL